MYAIFESEKVLLRFAGMLFMKELSALTSEAQLFRLDSPATKLSSVFMKKKGNQWLANSFGPLIREVLASPSGYEVDPEAVSKSDGAANAKRLEALCLRFFNQILSSMSSIPMDIRIYLNLVRQIVKRKAPSSELKSVGALLFLRYICPAMSSP